MEKKLALESLDETCGRTDSTLCPMAPSSPHHWRSAVGAATRQHKGASLVSASQALPRVAVHSSKSEMEQAL
jgi:hypothetical protein